MTISWVSRPLDDTFFSELLVVNSIIILQYQILSIIPSLLVNMAPSYLCKTPALHNLFEVGGLPSLQGIKSARASGDY